METAVTSGTANVTPMTNCLRASQIPETLPRSQSSVPDQNASFTCGDPQEGWSRTLGDPHPGLDVGHSGGLFGLQPTFTLNPNFS